MKQISIELDSSVSVAPLLKLKPNCKKKVAEASNFPVHFTSVNDSFMMCRGLTGNQNQKEKKLSNTFPGMNRSITL